MSKFSLSRIIVFAVFALVGARLLLFVDYLYLMWLVSQWPPGIGGPVDVYAGFIALLPLSILATGLYIRIMKTERNRVNDLSVFAAMFGIITVLYFLWRL